MKLRESHETRINCCREWLDCGKKSFIEKKTRNERVIKWSNIFQFNHIAFKWKHTLAHTLCHFVSFRLLSVNFRSCSGMFALRSAHTRTILLHFPNKLAENLLSLITTCTSKVNSCSRFSCFTFFFIEFCFFNTHSKWNAEIPMHLCYNKNEFIFKTKIISRRKTAFHEASTKVKLRLKESV